MSMAWPMALLRLEAPRRLAPSPDDVADGRHPAAGPRVAAVPLPDARKPLLRSAPSEAFAAAGVRRRDGATRGFSVPRSKLSIVRRSVHAARVASPLTSCVIALSSAISSASASGPSPS